MAEIDDNIASLQAAIASGTRRVVTQNGAQRREVEYQSLKEMREALDDLKQQKAAAAGSRFRGVLARF